MVRPSLFAILFFLLPTAAIAEQQAELARRGIAQLGKKNHEEALSCLRDATRIDQDNNYFNYDLRHGLEGPDREWGKAQLNQLSEDRPQLGKLIAKVPGMSEWVISGFGGAYSRTRVRWDPNPPTLASSECSGATNDSYAAIRIAEEESDSADANAEPHLANLCFEFHNVVHKQKTKLLIELAIQQVIKKEVFVAEMSVVELHAARETRFFYVHNVLPKMIDIGYPTDPYEWYLESWWITDDEDREYAVESDEYPWVPYAQKYDECVRWGQNLQKESEQPAETDP